MKAMNTRLTSQTAPNPRLRLAGLPAAGKRQLTEALERRPACRRQERCTHRGLNNQPTNTRCKEVGEEKVKVKEQRQQENLRQLTKK